MHMDALEYLEPHSPPSVNDFASMRHSPSRRILSVSAVLRLLLRSRTTTSYRIPISMNIGNRTRAHLMRQPAPSRSPQTCLKSRSWAILGPTIPPPRAPSLSACSSAPDHGRAQEMAKCQNHDYAAKYVCALLSVVLQMCSRWA